MLIKESQIEVIGRSNYFSCTSESIVVCVFQNLFLAKTHNTGIFHYCSEEHHFGPHGEPLGKGIV